MSITQNTPTVEAEPVALTIEGSLATVKLNRPQVRNAVDANLAARLEEIVEDVERNPHIRAVIITGAGDAAFCAGADLREVANGRLGATFTPKGGFAGFVNAVRTKPWIAAVNGTAVAGGFEIVLACDLVVAATDVQFGLPEVKRGLIASAGGLYRLPRSLPKAIALELILTGGTLKADRAFELGLVNRVVPREALMTTAQGLAGLICGNAPLAVKASLAIARSAALFEDDVLRKLGDESQLVLARSDDYKEGARAFLEKRTPVWRGE